MNEEEAKEVRAEKRSSRHDEQQVLLKNDMKTTSDCK